MERHGLRVAIAGVRASELADEPRGAVAQRGLVGLEGARIPQSCRHLAHHLLQAGEERLVGGLVELVRICKQPRSLGLVGALGHAVGADDVRERRT